MKKHHLLLSLISIFCSCSFPSSNKEEVTTRPSDELEFSVDTLDANVKVEEGKIIESKYPDEISPVEVKAEEKKIVAEESVFLPPEPKVSDYKISTEVTAQEEKYQVQAGDTLMRVAFKIYGDYTKWKDLKKWNKGIVKLSAGTILKYHVPDRQFGWQPDGTPYLVKTGDTLGIISKDKYGTTRKWKSIYENNRPLIRNPDLIFAGFTLYYIPSREVASKKE